jgi:hypothetical protein
MLKYKTRHAFSPLADSETFKSQQFQFKIRHICTYCILVWLLVHESYDEQLIRGEQLDQ